jgi:O-antigen/teichoic acid export membrane protein
VPWLAIGIAMYFISTPFLTLLQVRRRFSDVFWLSSVYSCVVLGLSFLVLKSGEIRFLGVSQICGASVLVSGGVWATRSEYIVRPKVAKL